MKERRNSDNISLLHEGTHMSQLETGLSEVILLHGTCLSHTNKETNSQTWRIRSVVAKREGEGVGGTGSLGLIDANCCVWNG